MRTPRRTRLALLALSGALALGSPDARATPEFPGIVEQTLGLSKIEIDPPLGCTLCHTTDSGGASLRPFGLLVQQDGAQPYEDPTLVAALDQVQQDDPQLIEDIKAGQDPNDDPDASSTPTPGYGCAVPRMVHRSSNASLGLAAVLGLWLVGARRRRLRSAR